MLENTKRRPGTLVAAAECFDHAQIAPKMQRPGMTGIRVLQFAARHIDAKIKCRRKQRRPRAAKDGEKRAIDLQKKLTRTVAKMRQLLDERAQDRSHQRRPHAMSHHIAKKNSGLR